MAPRVPFLRCVCIRRPVVALRGTTMLALGVVAASVLRGAPTGDQSPIGKVFFADISGDDVFVHVGDRSQPVGAKETYRAEGLGIATQENSAATMVFSNGLAVNLRPGSGIEVKKFEQEPFRPNRTDVAMEPSISAAQLDLSRGVAVISTSKLAAGSLLVVFTPVASVMIQGGTMLIAADADRTSVSILSGTCTVYSRSDSTRVALAKDGEVASVARAAGTMGAAVAIEVKPLTNAESAALTTSTWEVLRAKQTVYFEQSSIGAAFSATATIASPETGDGSATARPAFELNPVQIAPLNLPVQYTVSPAMLLPTRRG